MKKEITFAEDLVSEVQRDFTARREARRGIEAKWLLNVNFMLGNQYSNISPAGEIVDYGKRFYWQEREVYNHIAPIIESRLAKFARVNCSVNVRPASNSDNDLNVAKLSTKLIESAQLDNNFISLSASANYWSEVTGTVFYKVVWNTKAGKTVVQTEDKEYKEGNVSITVCPPYEVYPDNLSASDLDECRSLIHAKAYPVDEIENMWGKRVKAGDVSVIDTGTADNLGGSGFTAKSFKVFSGEKGGRAIVIERYERPDKAHPNGRLVIVAGDTLLFNGELPYINCINGVRGFPFVRQIATEQPAGFYGVSIIERLIPVQRAYNAVKNRKHEFINRLATGVLAVEDGSVDLESLEDEGLSPGKVITYRQGSTPPIMMSPGSVPSEFRDEEDRLLAEFVNISGVSNLAGSSLTSNTVSGYALSLLVEQDYSRLSVTTESMRGAVKELSKQILRLYRQFAKTERIISVSGDNGELEAVAFLGSDLTADDIVMEAESEMVETPAVRRNMVFDLLQNGLLGDENGKISNRNRAKILEMLGFGNWESARQTEEVHIKKCAFENVELSEGRDCGIEEVDDHDIHIEEHSRFLIAGRNELTDAAKDAINKHIREHKVIKRLSFTADKIN